MRKIRTSLLLSATLLSVGLAATVSAGADESIDRNFRFENPSGPWLLDVEFPATPGGPPPPPPFKETLTFHAWGTVSESNSLLNENSYIPNIGQGCGFTGMGGALELNCNGSDGTGAWRRTGRNTLSFVVVKLVYDGATNAHVGFLRVRGDKLRVNGDTIVQNGEQSLTEFLVGTDYETAVAIPLGGANARGIRIR